MGKFIFIMAILFGFTTGIVATFTKLDVTPMGITTVLTFFVSIFVMMFEADN